MKFLLAFLLPVLSQAAIWPDTIGPYQRAASMPVTLTDRPIWDEYGLKDSEGARYENGASRFTAAAYVLQDTTGAMAAFDWQRPSNSTPSKAAPRAVETADGLVVLHGNYLLSFTGYKPTAEELSATAASLRNLDTT